MINRSIYVYQCLFDIIKAELVKRSIFLPSIPMNNTVSSIKPILEIIVFENIIIKAPYFSINLIDTFNICV